MHNRMNPKAEQIKRALNRGRDYSHDMELKEFCENIQEDIENMIHEKYPFIDVKPEPYETEAFLKLEETMRLRGYMFDSLVFRYQSARDTQMRYEQLEGKKNGTDIDGERAKNRAERDKMRFIQILDEAIGVHE